MVILTSISYRPYLLNLHKNFVYIYQKIMHVASIRAKAIDPKETRGSSLRGRDVSKEKLLTIALFEKEGIKYSLVTVLARGINYKEVKRIVDFFFMSKALSLMFQPISFTGNASQLWKEELRLTIPDIVKQIEKSSYVNKGDFNPLPCSYMVYLGVFFSSIPADLFTAAYHFSNIWM